MRFARARFHCAASGGERGLNRYPDINPASVRRLIPQQVLLYGRQIELPVLALRHQFAVNALPGLRQRPLADAALRRKHKPRRFRACIQVEARNRLSRIFNAAQVIVVAFAVKAEAKAEVAGMAGNPLQLFRASVFF